MRNVRLLILFWLFLHLLACEKRTDWSFTLDKNSTEPYGLFIANDRLADMFVDAEIETIFDLPKEIIAHRYDTDYEKKNTLIISITNSIELNDSEATALQDYVTNGGHVLLMSNYFSDELRTLFHLKDTSIEMAYPVTAADSISEHRLMLKGIWYSYLLDIPFETDYFKAAPNSWGERKVGQGWETNVLVKKIGEGEITFANSPEMLTNYALLKDSNIGYYEKFFSHFNHKFTLVKWFSTNRLQPKAERPKDSFSQLLEQPPYRYAFITLLAMAVLFVLFETKRRQRKIAVIPPVTNDSLEFAETVGKLYFGEGDNRNLAQKMVRHYLEYIFSKHNIPAAKFNLQYAEEIARKLNKTNTEVEQFINYINEITQTEKLSESAIETLYHTLKKYS